MDLEDMFLHSPMRNSELVKVSITYFSKGIIENYNLNALVHNGYIYIKIKEGIYGLKQASVLAYQHLLKLLTKGDYKQIMGSLGMWKHKTRKHFMSLC